MAIQTGQERVHWGWLLLLSIPVATFAFVEKCSGTALTFTLRKHIDTPAWILLVGSINSLFAVVIAPWAAYKSDRKHSLICNGIVR